MGQGLREGQGGRRRHVARPEDQLYRPLVDLDRLLGSDEAHRGQGANALLCRHANRCVLSSSPSRARKAHRFVFRRQLSLLDAVPRRRHDHRNLVARPDLSPRRRHGARVRLGRRTHAPSDCRRPDGSLRLRWQDLGGLRRRPVLVGGRDCAQRRGVPEERRERADQALLRQ